MTVNTLMKFLANTAKVGCMMIRQVTQINWRYVGDVVPSFVVLTFIPFSYSVAYGLIAYVSNSFV
jgi:AGZA family xanthine/uracil permease-like MFS transporter